MISIQNLSMHFTGEDLFTDISFLIREKDRIGLVGKNGAGKTTLLKLICGLEQPSKGDVIIPQGVTIGYLPQEASIFRKMTVEENLLSILETTSLPHEKQLEKMEDLLEEFAIGHVRNSVGTALSGGERRRVEIARSLATDPAFILLDEPFAGIDPIAVADIQEMIAHLAKRGIGILITDHNVRETLSIVDKAYILASGEVLLHGDSESIANDPIAKKYYLGENFKM